MSETNWGDSEAPAPKKRIPTWLWFCGGGCLLALVLAIAGGSFLFVKFKQVVEEGSNPEIQWQRVSEVLPYDRHPDGVTLLFGWHLGVDMYVFDDTHGFKVVLFQFNELDDKNRAKALDANESGGLMGMGRRRNMSAVAMKIQGREIKGLRFDQMGDEERQAPEGMPKPGKGPAIMLDLTPENGKRALFLQMIRVNGTEPVKDEDVQRFLAPFHVGSDR